MPKLLTQEQVEQFDRDGFLSPIDVMSEADARLFRHRLEAYEATIGEPIQSNMRHNVHLLFTWADELIRHPRVVDAVEDILGPNLMCWITNFFIKEANDPGFVSWHQDSTYWGLDPSDVVTAWIALSDAPVESGAMKMLPGSHKWDQVSHRDTFHEHNLLSRGQEIEMDVDDKDGVFVPMGAGQMSLHHIKLCHGSQPNTTNDRRIGLAVRYIPTHVRQVNLQRDGAVLVRGEDAHNNFEFDPSPKADLDEAALAAHKVSMERLLGALMDGTEAEEFRA